MSDKTRPKAFTLAADYGIRVHATRAYIAGFGTAASMLAGAAAIFILASAVVSFNGWPSIGDQSPAPASVVLSQPRLPASSPAARRLAVALTGAPGVAAAATGGGAAGRGARGAGAVVLGAGGGATAGAIPRTGGSGAGGGSGGGPGPIASTVQQTANTTGRAVSGVGAKAGSPVSGVAGKVAHVAPGVAGTVNQTGQAAGGAVSGAGAAAGGAVSSTGHTAVGLLGGH